MYDDTVKPKCQCGSVTPCNNANSPCDCTAYCFLYERQVAAFDRLQCVTISPNPNRISDYVTLVDDLKRDLLKKLSLVTHDYIIVLELAGLRPHFHCVFDVKDPVGFNIKLLNASRYDNIKKHAMFKNGMHYMFKDVTKTYTETGIIPIMEKADIDEYNLQLKLKREEEEKERKLRMGIEVCDRYMFKF